MPDNKGDGLVENYHWNGREILDGRVTVESGINIRAENLEQAKMLVAQFKQLGLKKLGVSRIAPL